jgi:hypothetical protein
MEVDPHGCKAFLEPALAATRYADPVTLRSDHHVRVHQIVTPPLLLLTKVARWEK